VVEVCGEIPGVFGAGLRGEGWRADAVFFEEGDAVDGGFTEFGVELGDFELVFEGDGAGEDDGFAALESESIEDQFGGEQFGGDAEAIEGGVFEVGLFLEEADAFPEFEGIGVGVGEGGDFALDAGIAVVEELDGGEVDDEAEEVEEDEGAEAAHPEAVDELLLVTGGEFRREEIGSGLAAGVAACGELSEEVDFGGGVDFGGIVEVRAEGSDPRIDGDLERDEVPGGWGEEPAFDFGAPGDAGEVIGEHGAGGFGVGEAEKIDVLEGVVVPPGDEAKDIEVTGDEVDPGAVGFGGRGEELMEPGNFEFIGDEGIFFEGIEERLDGRAFGDDEDGGLKGLDGVRQGFEGPDDLVDRGGGEFFELEFEHGVEFIGSALREVDDAEMDVIGGEPSEVEGRMPEMAPAAAGEFGGDGLVDGEIEGGELRGDIGVEGELPQGTGIGALVEDVAGAPAVVMVAGRHGQDSARAWRCSSVWVTRRTSSMVVRALRTLFQPSTRRVRMPLSMARWAMVEAGARLRTRGRMDSESMRSS
jgi:hypothetical protein